MKKIIKLIVISLFLVTSLVACSTNLETSESEEELLLVDNSLKVDIIAKENPHEINIETTETTQVETREIENVKNEDNTNNDLLTTGMQNEISLKKELSIEEKNSILKTVDEFVVTDKESLKELVLIIDENIASFELRERDLLIRKYVLSLYDLMNNLNSVLSVIGYDLETVVSEYKINVNDKNSIQSIPDKYGTVKGFLLEVKDKGFFINSLNNNSFYLDLDLGNILEKYKDYISPSMNEYLNFNNYEMHNTMTLSETNTYNLEELANRINTLSLGLEVDKNNNYVMVDKYTSSLKYYYNLLLGLSHSQFVDNNNMFNGDILNMYKTLQTKYKDTTLGSVLEKTILVIEASENVYDENIKLMIDEYLNSLIYTQEIQDTLNNNTYNKYVILNTNENDEEIINENNKSE